MKPLPNIKVSNTALQVIRESRGMTQEKLAIELGYRLNEKVAKSSISHWESGRRYVPTKYIEPLCDVLECELDDLIIKPIGDTQDDLYDVPYSNIQSYDQKPVYVHFDKYKHADGWALVNYKYSDIELVFTDVTLRVEKGTEGITYYSKEPVQNIPDGILGKCMNLKELMDEYYIYVTMQTADREVRAMYNGWYRHNETKTALIKDDGIVLPYSGLGKSYIAHKQKEIKNMNS